MDPILYCGKCFHHFGLVKEGRTQAGSIHAGGNDVCGGRVLAKSPVYVGIFLDERSKQALVEMVKPVHPHLHAEHVTLAFGRHMKSSYPLGTKVGIIANFTFQDSRGQCVSVKADQLKEWLWEDQTPHITISCADGVKPFYSNELLRKEPPAEMAIELPLNGVLDYFPRCTK